jgi:succinate-semialdehyde dehydrogenase/glutarate-semialdehyde dehydrogenase
MADLSRELAQFGCELKDPSLFITKGFIDGQWRTASSGAQFPVYEPASATILAQVSNFAHADMVDAIKSAEVGQREYYASTTAKDRSAILRKWNDLVLENIDDSKHLHESGPTIIYLC